MGTTRTSERRRANLPGQKRYLILVPRTKKRNKTAPKLYLAVARVPAYCRVEAQDGREQAQAPYAARQSSKSQPGVVTLSLPATCVTAW